MNVKYCKAPTRLQKLVGSERGVPWSLVSQDVEEYGVELGLQFVISNLKEIHSILISHEI